MNNVDPVVRKPQGRSLLPFLETSASVIPAFVPRLPHRCCEVAATISSFAPHIVLSVTVATVRLSLGMVITSPDGVEWKLHEMWRARLCEAQYRYARNRNHETKAAYMRVLRAFKDLVFYGIVPRDQPTFTSEDCRSLAGET
jgi:hypothetical protein